MVFHWCLSDSKSPQVFRTLLCILADFSSYVVWMVSILNLIYRSVHFFSRFLEIVPKAPTMIDITVTFVFFYLFSSLVKLKCLSRFSSFFPIHLMALKNFLCESFTFLIKTRSSLLTWIGSRRILYVSYYYYYFYFTLLRGFLTNVSW